MKIDLVSGIALIFGLNTYLNLVLQLFATMSIESEFSKASGKRIIKNQSNMRVSDDSAVELVEELDDVGLEIAELAKQYADHAGRKTVRLEDVRQAIRDYRD